MQMKQKRKMKKKWKQSLSTFRVGEFAHEVKSKAHCRPVWLPVGSILTRNHQSILSYRTATFMFLTSDIYSIKRAFKIEMKKLNTFVFDACRPTQLDHHQSKWNTLTIEFDMMDDDPSLDSQIFFRASPITNPQIPQVTHSDGVQVTIRQGMKRCWGVVSRIGWMSIFRIRLDHGLMVLFASWMMGHDDGHLSWGVWFLDGLMGWRRLGNTFQGIPQFQDQSRC